MVRAKTRTGTKDDAETWTGTRFGTVAGAETRTGTGTKAGTGTKVGAKTKTKTKARSEAKAEATLRHRRSASPGASQRTAGWRRVRSMNRARNVQVDSSCTAWWVRSPVGSAESTDRARRAAR